MNPLNKSNQAPHPTNDSNAKPIVCITMGEPSGIGPELCARFLDAGRFGNFVPWVLGDARVLKAAGRAVGITREFSVEGWPSAPEEFAKLPAEARHTARIFDLPSDGFDSDAVRPGHFTAASGRASFAYVSAAVLAALAGDVDCVCTGPIQKEGWHLAGIEYPGHTELLADLTGTDNYCMMLTSDEITCSLVTTHVGLREVPDLLSTASVLRVIELSAQAMRQRLRRAPRIAVCGLNPHAGESGQFGSGEEQRIIEPAISAARNLGLDVTGPLPPDTAFLPGRRIQTDCYICMYHDQGLIPLKTLAFDQAVNVTLGLPIVRTSVDHGTALDIAWKGKGSMSSFRLAVNLAADLAAHSATRP